MCLAKRFRESVTPAQRKDGFDAGLQVHFMPGGDIDGLDSSPSSHDHAHGSTLLNQWSHTSSIQRYFGIGSIQTALGTSDRGKVQEQAEMGSNTHRSGMGDALAVGQNQIWLRLQFRKSLQQDRCFPEGKKTGNIRKGGPSLIRGAFQEDQIGIAEDKKGGIAPVIRAAVRDIAGADFFPRNFRRPKD